MTGKTDDIEKLDSVRLVNELLAQMRNFFRKAKQDHAALLAHDDTLASEKAQTADAEIKRRQTIAETGGVGDLDEIGEFGIGRALRDSKPVTKIEISKEKEAEIAAMNKWEDYEE